MDDLEFWQIWLKSPMANIQPGTKRQAEDRVRFRLFTREDFRIFEELVDGELQAMKWLDLSSSGEESTLAVNA